jgi:hypothetical protein
MDKTLQTMGTETCDGYPIRQCNHCNRPIIFIDLGMGNYRPCNVDNNARHFCRGLEKYSKLVKGRGEYSCVLCQGSIIKGELHFVFRSRIDGTLRFHQKCQT